MTHQPKHPRRKPGWLANVAVMLGTFLLLLLAAEVVCRVGEPGWLAHQERRAQEWRQAFVDEKSQLIQRHDPPGPFLYGWAAGAECTLLHRPQDGPIYYQINDDGHRGPAAERPKPPGVFRIVCLGDSVTAGYGLSYEDAFPAQLRARLHERGHTNVEVVNLAVNSYGFYQYPNQLQLVVPSYQPDLVLVQFCVNDLSSYQSLFLYGSQTDPEQHREEQAWLAAWPRQAHPSPDTVDRPSSASDRIERWPSQRVRRILDYSAAWRWVARRLHDAPISPGILRPPHQLEHILVAMADADSPEMTWLGDRLAEIADWRTSTDTPVLLLLSPTVFQTHARSDYGAGWRNLIQLAEGVDLPTVDLLPELLNLPLRGREHWIDNTHPDAVGHDAFARRITEVLLDEGFVDIQAARQE